MMMKIPSLRTITTGGLMTLAAMAPTSAQAIEKNAPKIAQATTEFTACYARNKESDTFLRIGNPIEIKGETFSTITQSFENAKKTCTKKLKNLGSEGLITAPTAQTLPEEVTKADLTKLGTFIALPVAAVAGGTVAETTKPKQQDSTSTAKKPKTDKPKTDKTKKTDVPTTPTNKTKLKPFVDAGGYRLIPTKQADKPELVCYTINPKTGQFAPKQTLPILPEYAGASTDALLSDENPTIGVRKLFKDCLKNGLHVVATTKAQATNKQGIETFAYRAALPNSATGLKWFDDNQETMNLNLLRANGRLGLPTAEQKALLQD